MRLRSIVLVCTLALLAGQAAGQAADKPASKDGGLGQCFRQSDIQSSTQASRSHLNIKTRDGRYFQIQTMGVCFDALGVDPYILKVEGGIDMVCRPIDIDLTATTGGMAVPCIVDKIVPMTKAEVSALPKREQP